MSIMILRLASGQTPSRIAMKTFICGALRGFLKVQQNQESKESKAKNLRGPKTFQLCLGWKAGKAWEDTRDGSFDTGV